MELSCVEGRELIDPLDGFLLTMVIMEVNEWILIQLGLGFNRIIQGQHCIGIRNLLNEWPRDLLKLDRTIWLLVEASGDGIMGEFAIN